MGAFGECVAYGAAVSEAEGMVEAVPGKPGQEYGTTRPGKGLGGRERGKTCPDPLGEPAFDLGLLRTATSHT